MFLFLQILLFIRLHVFWASCKYFKNCFEPSVVFWELRPYSKPVQLFRTNWAIRLSMNSSCFERNCVKLSAHFCSFNSNHLNINASIARIPSAYKWCTSRWVHRSTNQPSIRNCSAFIRLDYFKQCVHYFRAKSNISIKRYLQQTLIISGHLQITYDLT